MKNWPRLLQSRFFLGGLGIFTCIVVGLFFLFPKTSKYENDFYEIQGQVINYKIDGDLLSFVVKDQEEIQAFYYFKTEAEKNNWQTKFGYGLTVNLKGQLETPNKNTIPNTFNYQKYLYYQKIYKIMTVDTLNIVEYPHGLAVLKNKIRQLLQKMPHSEYLLTMLLGNSSTFDSKELRKNGISHLFAISGMHISLFITILAKIFQRWGSKKNIIISLFLLFYLFLVNFTPGVMRSAGFWFLKILNQKYQLHLSNKQIFCYLLCFLLLLNPFYLMNLGFQYSFTISFFLFFLHSSKNYFLNLLKISTLCFLVSLPISAMNFYEVNVLSIIWNLFFVPFVTIFLYPSCLLYLLLPFTQVVFTFLINVFELINSWCASLTWGNLVIPSCPFFLWLTYYAFLYLFCIKTKKIYIGILILLICLIKIMPKWSDHAFVYFLDVGQGDSTLLVAPHQKESILIDTGGQVSYHKESWQNRLNRVTQAETIVTFLHSLGLTEITHMAITHGDYDHGGNAFSLLEKMRIKNIYLNHNSYNSLEQAIINKYGSNVKANLQSKNFLIKEYSSNKKDENEASLIYQIEVFSFTFLLMGDAPKKVEQEIKKFLSVVDVLKVGHHGSKTSSDYSFLKKIKPELAVISVGQNNRYGHPNEETLQSLQTLKISYLRTDETGTIIVEVGPNFLKIHA